MGTVKCRWCDGDGRFGTLECGRCNGSGRRWSWDWDEFGSTVRVGLFAVALACAVLTYLVQP